MQKSVVIGLAVIKPPLATARAA